PPAMGGLVGRVSFMTEAPVSKLSIGGARDVRRGPPYLWSVYAFRSGTGGPTFYCAREVQALATSHSAHAVAGRTWCRWQSRFRPVLRLTTREHRQHGQDRGADVSR